MYSAISRLCKFLDCAEHMHLAQFWPSITLHFSCWL